MFAVDTLLKVLHKMEKKHPKISAFGKPADTVLNNAIA